MSFSTSTPPRDDEILPAVKTLLSVASINDLLRGSGRVAVQYVDTLENLNRTAEGRIVLMERAGNEGPTEHLDRVRKFEFVLRADVYRSPESSWDPNRLLTKIHQTAFTLIQGRTPNLTLAAVAHPIIRTSFPGRLWEKDHIFSKSAAYALYIKPV